MQVIYGRDEVELDEPDGVEVGVIQARLKSFFSLPADATASVNGIDVGPAELAGPDSTVEFRVTQGRKGVGRVWSPEEYCELFSLSREELDQQIQKGLRVMQAANGSMRITETAVDEFVRGMNGNGDGAFLAAIAKSLEKIASGFDPSLDHRPEQCNDVGERPAAPLFQPKRRSPYIDSKEAASYLGITVKSLYGQVERGHIKPLRGPKKTYRFTEKMLDEYLRS